MDDEYIFEAIAMWVGIYSTTIFGIGLIYWGINPTWNAEVYAAISVGILFLGAVIIGIVGMFIE